MKDKKDLELLIISCLESNKDFFNLTETSFNEKTKIFGKEGILDSISLVHFMVDVERKVNEKYNSKISIVDSKVMSNANSPFHSIETLTDYLGKMLNL